MREAVKLSPREEEFVKEIREIMEAKLVWYLLSQDLNVELLEDTDFCGMPRFHFQITTQWQKFNVVTVSMKINGWNRHMVYEVEVMVNNSRTMRYDRVEGVRKFIMEELT